MDGFPVSIECLGTEGMQKGLELVWGGYCQFECDGFVVASTFTGAVVKKCGGVEEYVGVEHKGEDVGIRGFGAPMGS